MMKMIILVLLIVVVAMTRKDARPVFRCYTGLVLGGLGALIWAGIFDAVGHGGDVTKDAVFYKHVLQLSLLGILTSLAGVIVSWWCRDKLLKVFSMLIGIVALFLCAVNVFVPY